MAKRRSVQHWKNPTKIAATEPEGDHGYRVLADFAMPYVTEEEALENARLFVAVSDLAPIVLRAMSIIRHGVEMVGPEPYEFTKDEVLDEAFAALEAVRSALQVPESNISAPDMLDRQRPWHEHTALHALDDSIKERERASDG